MREPFALTDYTSIWGLKARALYRSGSLAALFRVDPEGTFSHPEYPPLWPLFLAVPFALLAGAAVSLLPYWRRYPGYAEGLLVVFVLAALAEVRRFDEGSGAGVRIAVF